MEISAVICIAIYIMPYVVLARKKSQEFFELRKRSCLNGPGSQLEKRRRTLHQDSVQVTGSMGKEKR